MKFCWATINVKNMDKSLDFYQEVLGLKLMRKIQPDPTMEIVFLGEGDTQIELICHSKNNFGDFGQNISLGFVVESIEKFTLFLNTKNVPLHSGPFQPNPHIKFIYVQDPDGLKIQFVENI